MTRAVSVRTGGRIATRAVGWQAGPGDLNLFSGGGAIPSDMEIHELPTPVLEPVDRRPRRARLAIAVAVVAAVSIVVIGASPRRPVAALVPTASPGTSASLSPYTSGPSASAPASQASALAAATPPSSSNLYPAGDPLIIEKVSSLPYDRLLTSERFRPILTFQINGYPEICPGVLTTDRSIVMHHVKGCVDEIDIVRPWAVDCGTVDAHPRSTELATVLLAHPALEARKGSAAAARQLFVTVPSFVVIAIDRSRDFDRRVDDPDRCRLLPEPGTADDVIEIRGDVSQRLVLLDVADELVVIRLSVGGHDRVTGAEAADRGYANGDSDTFDHLWTIIDHLDLAPPLG